jgi:nitrosocyanin
LVYDQSDANPIAGRIPLRDDVSRKEGVSEMKKLLVLVMVAIMSVGLLTACNSSSGPTKELQVVMGENGEMKYNPDNLVVKKGENVKITLVNKDPSVDHTFVLKDFNVNSKTVKAGSTATVTFKADKTGTFEFVCDVPGHKDGGMHGTLKVEE